MTDVPNGDETIRLNDEDEEVKRPVKGDRRPLSPARIISDNFRLRSENVGLFGGASSGRSENNDRPQKKKLSWTKNIELDSEPITEVIMNEDKWGKEFAPSQEMAYGEHNLPMILFKSNGESIIIESRLMEHPKNPNNSIRLELSFQGGGYDLDDSLKGEFSSDISSLLAEKFISNDINMNIGDGGIFSFIEISMGYPKGEDRCQKSVTDMRNAITFIYDILSKMFDSKKKITIEVPDPNSKKYDKRPLENFNGVPPLLKGPEENVYEKIKALEVTDINMTLDDMGGNELLKEQISLLATQYDHSDFFLERGVTLPKGILLYGPPGTGKTLAAKVLAGEVGRKFYNVQSSDILSKYFGESEETLKGIFEHVETPCIIFIDEIDSIGANRDIASEPMRRVLNVLLQQLDGMQSDKDIILVAATNKKEHLDTALTRPGRFDRHILVDIPDELGRLEILKVCINKVQSVSSISLFEESISINVLAQKTSGLVGADISEIVRRCTEKAVYKSFQSKENILVSESMLLEEVKIFIEERKREEASKKQRGIGFAAKF